MADPLRAPEVAEDMDMEDACAAAPFGIGGGFEKLSVRFPLIDPARVRLFDVPRTLSLTSWLSPRKAAERLLNLLVPLPRSSLESRRPRAEREGPGLIVLLAVLCSAAGA